jgi:hypothetical protein
VPRQPGRQIVESEDRIGAETGQKYIALTIFNWTTNPLVYVQRCLTTMPFLCFNVRTGGLSQPQVMSEF